MFKKIIASHNHETLKTMPEMFQNSRAGVYFNIFIFAVSVSIFSLYNNNKKVCGFNNIFSVIFKILGKSKFFEDK